MAHIRYWQMKVDHVAAKGKKKLEEVEKRLEKQLSKVLGVTAVVVVAGREQEPVSVLRIFKQRM